MNLALRKFIALYLSCTFERSVEGRTGSKVRCQGHHFVESHRLGFLQAGISPVYAMWHPTPTWKVHVGTPLKGRSTMVHKIYTIFLSFSPVCFLHLSSQSDPHGAHAGQKPSTTFRNHDAGSCFFFINFYAEKLFYELPSMLHRFLVSQGGAGGGSKSGGNELILKLKLFEAWFLGI